MEVALYHATRRFAVLVTAAVAVLSGVDAWDLTHTARAREPLPELRVVAAGQERKDWASLPVVATRGPEVEIEGWVKRAPLGPFQVRVHGVEKIYGASLCIPSDCERTSIDIGGDLVQKNQWRPDALRHDEATGVWFVSTGDGQLLDAFYEVPRAATPPPVVWPRKLEAIGLAAAVVLTLAALALLRGSRHYLRLAYAEVPPPRASRAYRESARLPDRSREVTLSARLATAAVSLLSIAALIAVVSAAAR